MKYLKEMTNTKKLGDDDNKYTDNDDKSDEDDKDEFDNNDDSKTTELD